MNKRTWAAVVAAGTITFAYQGCGPSFVASDLNGSLSIASVEKTCGAPNVGRAGLRSLSNDEYQNSVRDILFVAPDLSSVLPPNSLGLSGFRNDSDALGNLDLEHLTKFYSAAEMIGTNIAASQGNSGGAYYKIFFCSTATPATGSTQIGNSTVIDPRTFKDKVPDAAGSVLGADYAGGGYEFYRNGRLSHPIFIKKSGTYNVRLEAAQKKGLTGNAKMQLIVNGALAKEFDVTGDKTFANYNQAVNFAAGNNTVEIIFTNDDYAESGGVTYDRNLMVKTVQFTSSLTGLDTLAVGAGCVKSVFESLTAKMFRKAATDSEVIAQAAKMVTMMNAAATPARGMADVVVSLLMDPRFLLVNTETDGGNLTNYALASKLSFMLWQSAPDEALVKDAAAGTLRDSDVLKRHISRMLKDARSKNLANTLRKDWLGLANFESGTFAGLSVALQNAYIKETSLYLEDMIANDRPLNWLLTSNETFVNKELADIYGVTFPAGADVNSFQKVNLNGSVRLGIMTQASVLAATAGGTDATHPVRRGVWVSDKILCAKPPPPPPGIPALPNTPTTEGNIRARLSAHTSNAACIGCHKQIDLYGLGMENFDAQGRYRTNYHDNSQVESYGSDSNTGLNFSNSQQLIQQISSVPQAKSCISETLLRLGSSRALSAFEKCSSGVRGQIAFDQARPFSEFIYQLVSSPEFLTQPSED